MNPGEQQGMSPSSTLGSLATPKYLLEAFSALHPHTLTAIIFIFRFQF